MDQSLHQNIFGTLNDLAEGMFRWVALQLEELSTCYSDGDLEGQLGRLPATLDETYSRIIEKIPKRLQEDALRFLDWLAFSFEPLTSRELVQIIGINMDYKIGGTTSPFNSQNVYRDPNDILSVCSGLVLHLGDKIKLAHFSVKEYLMDSSIIGRYSSIHLEVQLSHSHIAKFQDLLTPSTRNEQNIEEDHHLTRYSGTWWIAHTKLVEVFEERSQQFELWRKIWIDRSGADPNIQIQGGHYDTALVAAASGSHIEVVQALLTHGADPNAQGSHYGTALETAAYWGHIEIVWALLAHGADPNVQGGHYGTALAAAASGSHMEVIQALLAHNADPNVQRGHYGTALTVASYKGDMEVVQALLAHGADPNVQEGHYGTPLAAAASGSHMEVVQALLAHGADPNIQIYHYGTTLAAASYKDQTQVVQVLLVHGADPNFQAGHYGTALAAAASGNHKEVVQALLTHGADPNVQADHYGTALAAAASGNHMEVVQALLSHRSSYRSSYRIGNCWSPDADICFRGDQTPFMPHQNILVLSG
ncbi:ankyrin repeat-containing domain protein [Hysterangium stoloniferum]|nr:ankyrin repeat-containing domain protein [Hysterangium stoloniferum]